MSLTLPLMVLLLAVDVVEAPTAPFDLRPADVTVTLSHHGDSRWDGTFQASDVARLCGELPPEYWMVGVRHYTVGFPDNFDLDISDVSFNSNDLVAGATSTDSFFVSATVRTPEGYSKAADVLDTSRPNNSGHAELSVVDGIDTLKVSGTNDEGVQIDLTVVCRPKP